MPPDDDKVKQEAEAKAKAEADAKVKAGAKGQDEEGEEEEEEKEDAPLDGKAKDDYIAKLKEENKQRRLDAKELKKQLKETAGKMERMEKALGVLQGKKEGELDPVEKAREETTGKLRNAILKGELAAVARDAHDVNALLAVSPGLFKKVSVDVENETVDADELKDAVDALRKSKPYLFQGKGGEGEGTKVKGGKLPVDGGQPRTKGSGHWAHWKGLKEANQNAEAAEYYKKHSAEIRAEMSAST